MSASRPSKIVPRPGEPAQSSVASPVYRSASWLEAVRSIEYCVRCGKHGTEAAHRNEGKGKGIKVHDLLTAALCRECHVEIDQGKNMARETRRAEIDRAIIMTIEALFDRGWTWAKSK